MQCSLFGAGPAGFDAGFSSGRRVQLAGGAWIEHHPGWLDGHARVFEQLASQAAWHSMRRQMYEREVAVPRLLADPPEVGPMAELLRALSLALSQRYGWPLNRVSLAHYRDGRDSVAFHGDKVGSLANDCVIATVSVGAPRRFLLAPGQPKLRGLEGSRGDRMVADRAQGGSADCGAADCGAANRGRADRGRADAGPADAGPAKGGPVKCGPANRDLAEGRASYAFDLGWGDLFVMGGSCQRTWQHAVPKRAHADPRISIMFRPPIPGKG